MGVIIPYIMCTKPWVRIIHRIALCTAKYDTLQGPHFEIPLHWRLAFHNMNFGGTQTFAS